MKYQITEFFVSVIFFSVVLKKTNWGDKIGSDKKQKPKPRKKSTEDKQDLKTRLVETVLSMILITLAGVNVVFAISWLLHGFQQDLSASRETLTVFHLSKENSIAQGDIKVEIFNACGVPNIARQMTEFLRKRSVDVVFYDNFMINNKIHKISHTLIIDRKSTKKTNARRVAKLINAQGQYVIHQLSPDRVVDVTILIGKDYTQLLPFQ